MLYFAVSKFLHKKEILEDSGIENKTSGKSETIPRGIKVLLPLEDVHIISCQMAALPKCQPQITFISPISSEFRQRRFWPKK